jgi:trimethylamine--corrinoid protein Co-methyltransferase
MVTDKGIVPVKGGMAKVLYDEEIQTLHEATVEVLNDVGIKLLHDEALEIMHANGCTVDFDEKIVKISEDVLMKYISKAPSEVMLYGRDPKYDIRLDDRLPGPARIRITRKGHTGNQESH